MDQQLLAHPLPNWLDDAFLQRIVVKLMGDKEFKITDTQIKSISRRSDPFASPIFRVQITGRINRSEDTTEHSLVLKVPAADSGAERRQLFDNEIRFYTGTLEEMHRLVRHCSTEATGFELGARVIHYSAGAEAVLVLQDLVEDQYEPLDDSLSTSETIAVLHRLAKWHAASIYLAKDNHDLQYGRGVFNAQHRGDRLQFMYDNFVHFAAEVPKWNLDPVYAQKLAALVPKFFERGEAIFAPSADGLNVLNHGDLGMKNILLRDHGQGIGVKFIDFQYCVWATPAIDLYYVMHLLCPTDVLTGSIDRTKFVKYYYKELTYSLGKMGYLHALPTLQQLQIELLKNGFIDVIVNTCLLPFIMQGHDSVDLTAENLQETRKAAYANEQFKTMIKHHLPNFLHKGYLD